MTCALLLALTTSTGIAHLIAPECIRTKFDTNLDARIKRTRSVSFPKHRLWSWIVRLEAPH